MKKTPSICLLFCLLASSAVAQVALALETGPAVIFKVPVIETLPVFQDLTDTWVLESSDDELLGAVEKQLLAGVATTPALFALAPRFAPGLTARGAQSQGGIHPPPLYLLLSSYRI